MEGIRYFPGGNTAEGFHSRFEDILPTKQRKHVFYLKGGPGVGKSTLMRRVAEAAEAAGETAERFPCSSDPDSLDGVSLPTLGVALMDGTAPHVYDPIIPGARDTLLSLGDFLDEAALRPHARELARLQEEIGARFGRCYRYLAAAKQVRAAAARGRENPARAGAMAARWAEGMPLRGGEGSVRRLFGSAYTPRGYVAWDADCERVITVSCPFGLHATGLMRRTAELAAARGLHAVLILDPLEPGEALEVRVPAHGLRYRAADEGRGGRRDDSDDERVEASEVFDLSPIVEKELHFDRNAFELLIQRATEQLAAAKGLHDELEQHYAGCMDFLRWEETLKRVLEEIGV